MSGKAEMKISDEGKSGEGDEAGKRRWKGKERESMRSKRHFYWGKT